MLKIPIILFSFSGVLFGLLLRKLAKQEIKQSKKYIQLSQNIILLLLTLSLLYNSQATPLTLALIIFGFFFYYIIKNIYFYLGLLIFSFTDFLTSFLIFAYTLSNGILIKNIKKIIPYFITYIIPLILTLSPKINPYYLPLLIGTLTNKNVHDFRLLYR